ncbi:MAG: phosphotransferase [Endomicrobium sp.]|jgi:predicted metal-dependent phosphoesterase TrpH/thiamine kinase-like enzyme|nr:phosphotransferase [Endomicrobium sp.]
MLLELHCHSSRHSKCSAAEPQDLIKQAIKKDLHGLIFTEHGYLWCKEEIEELRKQYGIDRHFLLLSAQEVDTDFGHVVVYGADKSLQGKYKVSDIRALYPDAALVWAHPLRKGAQPSDEKFTDKNIDAVEIFSLNHTIKENYLGLKTWHRLKFTAVCASDAHSADKAGAFPALFDHPVASIEETALEIKRGRCRPFYKETMLSGSRATVTEVVIGTKGQPEQRERIIIKKSEDDKTWKEAKNTALVIKDRLSANFADKNYRIPLIYEIDDSIRAIMEEGQRGQQLSKLLSHVGAASREKYFKLAAKWLAKLHSYKIKPNVNDNAAEQTENKRLKRYKQRFEENKTKHSALISYLIENIAKKENEIYFKRPQDFIFLHGDYHPGNIIIGQDDSKDPDSSFVSVIDFNNSINFVKEFDAGYFLAQYQSQFSDEKELLDSLTQDLFLKTYFDAQSVSQKELNDAMFFKLRAYLSIASFFHSMGMGESQKMDFIAADIEKTLSETKNVFEI